MDEIDRPIRDPQPGEVDPALVAAYERLRENIIPSTRIDGWTGARQKRFLEFIADGATVEDACRLVHMSVPSAYAFRRRARGQAFHLGWQAADLLARERIAGDLLTRAVQGQTLTKTAADGSRVTTHRYDNRLALRMLDRLDRYADASERTAPGRSARMVAAEFDAYLDLVGAEGGPARAGLFMLAREEAGDADELAPVRALARADRLVRCGTVDDVPVADLDPARRATWTAEQWIRAEAAGLVALAPPPVEPAADPDETSPEPILPSTCSASPDDEGEEDGAGDEAAQPEPVWWCERAIGWRTSFPPEDGFLGEQSGEPGEPDYERELDEWETAVMDAPYHAECDERAERGEAERVRFFAEQVTLLRKAGIPFEGDDDESGDPVDATSASPAGEPAAERPDSFDATGKAALAPRPAGTPTRPNPPRTPFVPPPKLSADAHASRTILAR